MAGFDPSTVHDPAAPAYAFAGSRMLVHRAPQVRVPTLAQVEACGAVDGGPFEIGRPGQGSAVAVAISAVAECGDLEMKGLRELFGLLTEPEMDLAARAFQTLEWSAAHAFCGRCGTATVFSTTEPARTCPSCDAMYFPRITPAVITLVRKGPEVLLARGLASARASIASSRGSSSRAKPWSRRWSARCAKRWESQSKTSRTSGVSPGRFRAS